eukprot:7381029-Prymnesium_polylepis.1
MLEEAVDQPFAWEEVEGPYCVAFGSELPHSSVGARNVNRSIGADDGRLVLVRCAGFQRPRRGCK